MHTWHMQGDIQRESETNKHIPTKPTYTMKFGWLPLIVGEEKSYLIMASKPCTTARAPWSQVKWQPNKPLLWAQQAFLCFCFKGSHTNALHSLCVYMHEGYLCTLIHAYTHISNHMWLTMTIKQMNHFNMASWTLTKDFKNTKGLWAKENLTEDIFQEEKKLNSMRKLQQRFC